jgi:TP901 family phage tail tape measure protein
VSSRTVAVVLKAQVDNYVSQMKAAERQTTEVEKAARTATQQFQAHNEALTKVGVGMAAVGAAAAVGLAVAVKAAADYGAKMAQLQTLSHATTNEMKTLSDAAMKQGQAFGFSATQVADAEIELTKAGRDASQILGGDLKGALALAAAGQMDVAQATAIGVTALTQFAKSGATIPMVADDLAAGADKALGSVTDLGQALNQGGLVASQMGLNLHDTVGTLSAFAEAGLIGSDAGTSFKTMLLSLQSPSQQAEAYLKKYNITAYDSKGAFVGIANLAGQLKTNLSGVSQAQRDAALSTIFGTDAIRAANVLYTQGKTGIQGWIKAVDDTGFASAQAAGKLNSLQGDVQKLSAAFQTDLIKAGTSADGAFRGPVQSATALVEVLGNLNPGILAVGTGAVALVAGVGLLGGAFLIAVPKIAAFKGALTELNLTGKGAVGIFGKGAALLLGITAVASGFAAMAETGTASAQQISLAGDKAMNGWKGVDSLFSKAGNALNAGSGLKNSLDELGNGDSAWTKWLDGASGGLLHLSDVYKTNEGQFAALGEQLGGLAKQDYGRATASFNELVSKYHLGADETKTLLNSMPAYRDELIHQAEAAKVSASDHNLLLIAQGKGAVGAKVLAAAQASAAVSAAEQAEQTAGLQGAASSANISIDDLAKTIQGFGSVTLDARSAQREFEKSVDDARAAAKKAGDATKDSTQADRDKQAALDGVASSAIATAAAFAKQPGGIKKAQDALADGRKAFIDVAKQMGIGREAAKKLADQLGLIPGNVKTAVGLSGVDGALTKVAELRDLLNGLHSKAITITATGNGAAFSDARNSAIGRAGGGDVSGPGPKGVDSVYAILAPGEHVLTAAEVDKMGGQSAVYKFRAELDAYATGGAVGEAQNEITSTQKSLVAAKKALTADKAKAAREKKAYTEATDAAEKISGKGTAAAKHAAEVKARALDRASQAADKAATAAQNKVDSLSSTLDDARSKAESLSHDREDFVSTQSRATADNPIDPLSYVDQLRSMSRNDDYSVSRRKSFDDRANKYEKSLVSLETQASAAASTLSTLKDSAKQLHDSVQQAVTGSYGLSDAAQKQIASGWIQHDGIRFQTTSGGPSASSIAGYYAAGAQTAQQFADALKQLAGRGVNTSLLAELAQMGTTQGLPIAQALLAGSASDLQSISSSYGSIASAADAAGTTVSDATYATQIAAADANAQKITDAINTQSEALRKVIAAAFGLKGYATGTASARPGIHWVGEHGPELAGFGGGEAILNSVASKSWVRGFGSGGGAAPQITVQAAPVTFPDTITVQDASGFKVTMRVVAQQEIASNAMQTAVLMMGGAA